MPKGKSVAVALSGGLDSTMAAYLLKQNGFAVTGVHFNLFKKDRNTINEIQRIVEQLDIVVNEIEIEDVFNETVVEYFKKEYFEGRTPCPCSFCNMNIKWEYLLKFAEENKIDFISTGHYVRTYIDDGVAMIRKGVDPRKDQSYFLWKLPSSFIEKTLTPLGNYTKDEVRAMAKKVGFEYLLSKSESMGICFLQGKDYRELIGTNAGFKTGEVLDIEGNFIGQHDGVHNYTIGQKKGLTSLPNGHCVVKIIAKENKLVVGPWENLNYKTLHLVNCNFPSLKPSLHFGLQAKIRGYGKNPDGSCTLTLLANNSAKVELSEPAWAPMPGQTCVIYKNDILVGGGYLDWAE